MTLANKLSIARIVIVPLFAISIVNYSPQTDWMRFLAIGLFALATVTDALDGIIARSLRQKTKLGSFLDPMADKLLLNVAFVFLAVHEALPVVVPGWIAILVLARDVTIVMGAWYINEFHGPLVVRPRFLGKVTTTCQMISILWVLLALPMALLVLQITAAATILSFVDYLWAGSRQLGEDNHAEKRKAEMNK